MTQHPFLASLELHGIKLGLDNITELLQFVGNPHRTYPTIHIAGTNGKGSVVALIDAMLRAADYQTGRFTSPHLISLNERFLHNGSPISDTDLSDQIAFFRERMTHLEFTPTFFEFVTAVAFRWFSQISLDAAIIEVGLGGRLDSTNVITPMACAITSIDYDHMRYLGDTLELIAYEKAGILKPGAPAVISEIKPAPLAVIQEQATRVGAPLTILGRDFSFSIEGDVFNQRFSYTSDACSFGPVLLALAGRHQGVNAATAVTLAHLLQPAFPKLNEQAIVDGLRSVRWPCRLERVLDEPPVILDVAHNVAGAATLAASLPSCIVILAVSSDKNARGMIDALSPVAKPFIFSQFEGERATSVDHLCTLAAGRPVIRTESIAEALEHGVNLASRECPLLVTGSIFTVGEARDILIRRYGAPPLEF